MIEDAAKEEEFNPKDYDAPEEEEEKKKVV